MIIRNNKYKIWHGILIKVADIKHTVYGIHWTSPGGSVGNKPACSARDTGDVGLIPVLGRCPGGGHGNPLQYSCLENHMDRGARPATVPRAAKSGPN